MYPQVIFQMSEERFQAVCIVWDIRFIDVFEHVGDCPVKMDICPSYVVVSICQFSCFLVDRLLLDELLVVFVPLVQFLYPIQLVVIGLDMADLAD